MLTRCCHVLYLEGCQVSFFGALSRRYMILKSVRAVEDGKSYDLFLSDRSGRGDPTGVPGGLP